MRMVMYINNVEMKVPGAGVAELVFTAEDGTVTTERPSMNLKDRA